VLGSLLLIPSYLLMAYTHVSLYIPMVLMGVAFSLIPAVLWPLVAYMVDRSKLGTAYGLMTMMQNLGLLTFNLIIGWANVYDHAGRDNPGGYNLGMWIFSFLALVALICALQLRRRELLSRGHSTDISTIS